MCNCKNIAPQSQECYDQMVVLEVPDNVDIRYNNPDREKKTHVSIDPCLVEEIKFLWSKGVVTTGCCCGHNSHPPYIGVTEEFIPVMKSMGYKVSFNKCRPKDEDSFTPKFF